MSDSTDFEKIINIHGQLYASKYENLCEIVKSLKGKKNTNQQLLKFAEEGKKQLG